MTWGSLTKTLGWFSKGAVDRMRVSGSATCNHVLPMIQWVGRTPESFTVDPGGAVHELLPDPAGRWRWWWNQRELARAADEKRAERGISWNEVAGEMCVPVTMVQSLSKLRYGPPIGLAMIVARWLGRSAASFMSETPPGLQP